MSPNLPSEAAYALQNIESPSFLIHFIASNLQIDVEKKQTLLETRPILERAKLVLTHLEQEIRVLQISEEIRHYPGPIARCDEHLPALLDERSKLIERLKSVQTPACNPLALWANDGGFDAA